MKIPGTNFDLRMEEPPEKIEMFAHQAICRYCNGIVKMSRDPTTFSLLPNKVSCLLCGQRYYVEIFGSIDEWEAMQWNQKYILEDNNIL